MMAEAPPYIRLVLCREDLPENPRWRELGYPDDNCWDPIELMSEAAERGKESPLFREARRIYWEALHRLWRTYKRGRPFFRMYWCDVRKHECVEMPQSPANQRLVLMEIVSAAMRYGVGVPGVKIYERYLGRPIAGGTCLTYT